jgi:hypothetical protein
MYGKRLTYTYLRDLGEGQNQSWKLYVVVFNEIII